VVSFAPAKIQPPAPRRGRLLARPALEGRLRDALAARRAVLLAAPAGSGKTALLMARAAAAAGRPWRRLGLARSGR
jgi:ATP/maltotriose-dependent transcriptional regulator MalT